MSLLTDSNTTLKEHKIHLMVIIWSYVTKNPFSGNKKGKRKVQGVPQSQNAALHRPQEDEETDKSKQAKIEQTYEKH